MRGFGLVDTMRTAGWPMLLDFARISMRPLDIGWTAAGVVAALLSALRKTRRATRTAP
jgi:hypothetical protein